MSTGRVKCPECNYRNPSDKQFCQICLTNLHFQELMTIDSTPSWVTLQKNLLNRHGGKRRPKAEMKMQDEIEYAKKKELRTSKRAANWEAGRKREWAANRPYYMKNGGKF